MIARRAGEIGGGGIGGGPGSGSAPGSTLGRWRVVIPGWPQWRRGDRVRAMVLAGSYASAMMVGLFAWGTGPGAALLGFAALTHSASVADAIRQAAFPGFGAWAPWFSAAAGLGGAGYAPALAVALQFACPAWTEGGGYLINRSAFEGRGPEAGHWVWLDRERPDRPRRVALVVAIGGQRVSWSEGVLRVDGMPASIPRGVIDEGRRSRGEFDVPAGALLVFADERDLPGPAPGEAGDGLLTLVASDLALGQAWARYFPIWRRGLLG
ncbi:S26 family signal peptidase [Tautonia plasticadhaerens]|uniref:Uncharacterized protein n=1 Tax=Tautonia plasticadhaerens TaxID=2527974 RepID=A0A518H4Z5_9BACT|nr:hypothetical protein [Tautonia plasticadhaerens]QDV35912.1 hypothetical protein ElP_38200 [Tautonia plasticadhaerens]